MAMRHDRRYSPPYAPPLMDLEHESQLPPWRPTATPSSRFRSASNAPVLPRISSLLNNSQDRKELPHKLGERRKRKLPLRLDTHETLRPPEPKNRPPLVMYMPQNDEELRVRRPSLRHYTPLSADYDDAIPTVSSAMRRPVYRAFISEPREEEMAFARPKLTDMSTRYEREPLPTGQERRQLYFHHSVDPHKIHEIHIPEVPQFREVQTGKHEKIDSRYYEATGKHEKMNRYCETMAPSRPAWAEEEQLVTAQKRRRVAPTPSPLSQPRQPLYEAEYGLTVLETSIPLMRSRYSPTMDISEGVMPTARRRYNSNGFVKVASPTTAARRISYGGGARMRSPVSSAPPPAPAQATAETSSTELDLKFEEFKKSESVVLNRHDEIDWGATFQNVGFDGSSIYADICSLRKGRWKSEEENYTMGLLKLIENGTILLRHGQSIRGYVGEKLHSDDMRVLKKLSNCKMFHFAKLINPRLAEEEKLDTNVTGAKEGLERLDQLKREFLRSVQLEAIVAVRKHHNDSSLRDLFNVRA